MAPQQINVEYWFREIYDLFFGADVSRGSSFSAWLSHIWIWITVVGYGIAALALVLIVYCILQLFELRAREQQIYGIVHVAKETGPLNPRWAHIQTLMKSENPNDWRQAIIEADIMLADMLTTQGYHGASIGDQLKQVNPDDFDTLNDAWEAHKVRNDIAHEGSAFNLSPLLANRTIARYENVFDEFEAI